MDLVTLALNLYTRGISPQLDFSRLPEVVQMVEECNQLPVHPRYPYAGELVFTAFSGSHQDAIKKGFAERQRSPDSPWRVPYLPLDPKDVGCDYEAVIRVNSQSGKSGAAWLLEQDHGLKLPRALQIDFSKAIQQETDSGGHEMTRGEIWGLFRRRYGLVENPRFVLVEYDMRSNGQGSHHFNATLRIQGQTVTVSGQGNGLLSAAASLQALLNACQHWLVC